MAERIGVLGPGHMGHGLARNIVEAGCPVTVMMHRNRVPVDDLAGRSAAEADSPRVVGVASDIVFLCRPGSPQVEAAIRGADGLAAGLANPLWNAVRNAFAAAVAGGGDGPEDYVPMLVEHVGRLNGVRFTPGEPGA